MPAFPCDADCGPHGQGGRPVTAWMNAMPGKEVMKARIPILFIHGDRDTFVPCSMVHELQGLRSPKELLVIPEPATQRLTIRIRTAMNMQLRN